MSLVQAGPGEEGAESDCGEAEALEEGQDVQALQSKLTWGKTRL